MKSATIFLLVLVFSAALAVPSAPRTFSRRDLFKTVTDVALKSAQDFKLTHGGTNEDDDDLLQPFIDLILNANWRVIIEESITTGDKLCDIVYDTFNQVESRIGADAAKYIQDNFEPVIGEAMAVLFKEVIEYAHDIISFWSGWGPWVIPYSLTLYFSGVVFGLERYISRTFVDAISSNFPQDSQALADVFQGFETQVVEETAAYFEIILQAFFPESH